MKRVAPPLENGRKPPPPASTMTDAIPEWTEFWIQKWNLTPFSLAVALPSCTRAPSTVARALARGARKASPHWRLGLRRGPLRPFGVSLRSTQSGVFSRQNQSSMVWKHEPSSHHLPIWAIASFALLMYESVA